MLQIIIRNNTWCCLKITLCCLKKKLIMFAPKQAPLVLNFNPKTQRLDSHEKLGVQTPIRHLGLTTCIIVVSHHGGLNTKPTPCELNTYERTCHPPPPLHPTTQMCNKKISKIYSSKVCNVEIFISCTRLKRSYE